MARVRIGVASQPADRCRGHRLRVSRWSWDRTRQWRVACVCPSTRPSGHAPGADGAPQAALVGSSLLVPTSCTSPPPWLRTAIPPGSFASRRPLGTLIRATKRYKPPQRCSDATISPPSRYGRGRTRQRVEPICDSRRDRPLGCSASAPAQQDVLVLVPAPAAQVTGSESDLESTLCRLIFEVAPRSGLCEWRFHGRSSQRSSARPNPPADLHC